jgi:hypothetical protein
MTARPSKQRPEETVRKIAELALNDAIELHVVIALLKRQTGEVNKHLDEAGASGSTLTLVSRVSQRRGRGGDLRSRRRVLDRRLSRRRSD